MNPLQAPVLHIPVHTRFITRVSGVLIARLAGQYNAIPAESQRSLTSTYPNYLLYSLVVDYDAI